MFLLFKTLLCGRGRSGIAAVVIAALLVFVILPQPAQAQLGIAAVSGRGGGRGELHQ